MEIHIHIHHELPASLTEALEKQNQKLDKIMDTQAQAAATLRSVAERDQKILGEIATLQETVNTLTAKVQELQGTLAQGGTITQELQDAINEVVDLTARVDDQIPDLTTQPVVSDPPVA